jgi:hypothetical protein
LPRRKSTFRLVARCYSEGGSEPTSLIDFLLSGRRPVFCALGSSPARWASETRLVEFLIVLRVLCLGILLDPDRDANFLCLPAAVCNP